MKKTTSLLYGIHPVRESIESGKTIDKVWIQEGRLQGQLAELLTLFRDNRILWRQVPSEKLNSLVRGNHQGVVISLSVVDFVSLEEIVQHAFEKGEDPFVLVLDGVTDVRNFGAIARTASCAGVHGILVPELGSAPLSPDALKTSAGALLKIPVSRTNSLHHALKFLKNSGLQIYGATEKAKQNLYSATFEGPVALVMGSEDSGISNDAMKMCDDLVSIPIMKSGVESLNVSVAAGISIYEVLRQRTKN